MAVVWEDLNCRARKIEGGYESVLNWDEEELIVNYLSFEDIAEILEEELGRKPTPEEVEEEAREIAGDPECALDTLPPLPRRGEEDLGEMANNWERVRKSLGMPDLEGKMAVLKGEMAVLKKQREKEGIKD